MNILNDILDQIDRGITTINLQNHDPQEIKNQMNEFNTSLVQRLIFSKLINDSCSDLFKEFAKSNYPWSLIQHCYFNQSYFIGNTNNIDCVKLSKLIDLTSANMYCNLLMGLIKNGKIRPDAGRPDGGRLDGGRLDGGRLDGESSDEGGTEHFINYYVNINDPTTSVIWNLLEYIFSHSDTNYLLTIAVKLSKIKELVIVDNAQSPKKTFDYVKHLKNITGCVSDDISFIIEEFSIQMNNKTSRSSDDYEIIATIIQIFHLFGLAEQITFINNLFIWFDEETIFGFLTSAMNEIFLDSLWERLEVDKLFDKYHENCQIDENFCYKMLRIYPDYSDKVLVMVISSFNTSCDVPIKAIFPDITGYQIMQVLEKI